MVNQCNFPLLSEREDSGLGLVRVCMCDELLVAPTKVITNRKFESEIASDLRDSLC